MSQIDDLMSAIPVSQLAAQVGASEAETEQAIRQALPALVGGMKVNADDPEGARSLAGALREHESDAVVDGGVNLDRVDPQEGQKIVGHVFGGQTDTVVNQLGGMGNVSGDLVKKLLPILAPIVLSWLAKQFGQKAPTGAGAQEQGGLGGVLGDLLGGALGGAGGGKGAGLDDLLGGILRGR